MSTKFAIISSCLVAIFASAQTVTTLPTQLFIFPPIGVGSTQTARINVVNAAWNSASGATASCTGQFGFMTSDGAPIGNANPFTLVQGQVATVALTFAGFPGSNGNHAITSGFVQLINSIAEPFCKLDITFELDDTVSGAVQVVLTHTTQRSGLSLTWR